MTEERKLEILAALDNERIIHPNDDFVFRLACAVVAKGFGYKSRADWTDKVREKKLVDYGIYGDDTEKAKENYKAIIKKWEEEDEI